MPNDLWHGVATVTPMNSKRLSERIRQPGHDQTYRTSETNFIAAASEVLDLQKYLVNDHPKDLQDIFSDNEGTLGIIPEASITNRRTGRKFFVEVKKQGAGGNAEERAFKHHTVQFYKTLQSRFKYRYHPFVTVFCENLSSDRRYTLKFAHLIEPDNYLLWTGYDPEILKVYLNERCKAWLD